MPGGRLQNAVGRGNVLRTMHASNKPDDPASPELALALGERADAVQQLWCGSLGHTVRCVPSRRTVAAPCGEGRLFGKWRIGHRAEAAAEWHWLHVLPMLGLRVPEPVAWLGAGRRTLLVTAGLPGRPLDAWAVDAAREGWLPELVRWASRHVAPLLRLLHDRGIAYRDAYWNHVFCRDPRRDEPPLFLDVERVFRPRWWRQRWWIKDLAGLLSSVPVAVAPRDVLRFARAYFGERLRLHRRELAAIGRKARRIRTHQPKYG